MGWGGEGGGELTLFWFISCKHSEQQRLPKQLMNTLSLNLIPKND